MVVYNYSNTSIETALASGITSTSSVVALTSTTGLPVSYPYTLAIDYGQANVEVVTVTGPSGLNLAVTRGEDGTAAQAHNPGAVVVHGVVARDLKGPQDHMAASTGVHGVAGTVVGTSDTQTLSNKTINGSVNTLQFIPDSAVVTVSASKLTGNFNGGAQFVAASDTVVPVTAKVTATATGSAFEIFRGAARQAYWGPFGEIVSNSTVTGSTLTGQGSGNTPGLVSDVPSGNTADLAQFKRNAVTLSKIDKDGIVTAAGLVDSGNASVGGTLGVTGTTTAAAINATIVDASTDVRQAGVSLPRGIIGGKVYSLTVGNLINAMSSAAGEVTAMDTGSLSLKSGRRYAIKAWVQWNGSGGGQAVEFRIREDNTTGTSRFYTLVSNTLAGTPYVEYLEGWYEAASNLSKTFVVTAKLNNTGTINVQRGNGGTENVRIEVYDVGPVGSMIAV